TGPAPPGRPVCAPAAMAVFSLYRRPAHERRPNMWFTSLLHRRRRPPKRCRRRPQCARLHLELLESRDVPSTLNVNTDTEATLHTDVHNETSIAVNPTNPLNLIGSVNDYQSTFSSSGQFLSVTEYSRAHVTLDGGQTWTDYTIPFNEQKYTFTGD